VDGPQNRNWGSKIPPTVREDQVSGHLRNLNIYKSMGIDEMHPGVLRELTDVVAKPLSMISEGHGSQVKSPLTEKREALHPFLKRVERTLGTTNLSASPLCLGRSCNRSS